MRLIWAERFLFITLFLLPWQTRWIFFTPTINSEPSAYGQISLYATEVLILCVVLLRGRTQIRSGLQWVIQAGYFLLAAAFFSLGASAFFHIGLGHVLHLLFAFALLNLLCDVRTSTKNVAIAFLSGLLVPILLSFFQVITSHSPASTLFGLASKNTAELGTAVVETSGFRLLRAYATFPHPNIFGGYLAVSFVVFAWLIRDIRSRKAFWLSFVTTILMSAAFFLTFSRSAWLALTISIVILLLLMKRRQKFFPIKIKPIIILGFITIFTLTLIFRAQVFTRLRTETRIEQISINERVSQYTSFGEVLHPNPILGVGPAAYSFALSKIHPTDRVWSLQPIHNAYLLLLAELGVVGFIAFLYFFIRIDQVSSRSAKTAGGMLGLCLGVVLLIISFFDHYLWSLWPGLALCAVACSFVVNWANSDP